MAGVEAESFVTPGHLPPRRNYCGLPPRQRPHYPPHPHHPHSHRHHPYSQSLNSHHNHHHHHGPQTQAKAPWMTPEIRNELNVRNRLKMASQNSPEDYQAYQDQCKKVQGMIDVSKANLGPPMPPSEGNSGPDSYFPTPNPGFPPPDPTCDPPNFPQPPPDQSCPPNPTYPSPDPNYTCPYPSHPTPGQAYSDPQLGRDPATLEAIAAYYRDPSNYYAQTPQRKVYTCGPCNRTYFSKRMLDKHMEEHVECPFPECRLSAHMKVIDQHINNQHMLVNFANLQIDDETWIAERKKRFPSVQRADVRRSEMLEKLKRGERLGKSTKPFAKKQDKFGKTVKKGGSLKGKEENQKDVDRNRVNKGREGKVEERGKRGTKRKRRERPPPRPRAHLDVDMFDSDEDDDDRLPAFQGTRHFYESTGELSYFGSRNPDIVISEEEEDGDGLVISDEDEWPAKSKGNKASSGGLLLGGALGSLMAAYSGSEGEDEEPPVAQDIIKPVAKLVQTTTDPLPKPSHAPDDASIKESDKKEVTEEGKMVVTKEIYKNRKHRSRRRPRPKKNVKSNKQTKARNFPRRRRTLLERLLQPDIIHERNVILQCVRYIVENNFFDDCDNKGSNMILEQTEKGERETEGEEMKKCLDPEIKESGTEGESKGEEIKECLDHEMKESGTEGESKGEEMKECLDSEIKEIETEGDSSKAQEEMKNEADTGEEVRESGSGSF